MTDLYIIASNMLHAQGVRLSDAQEQALTERADGMREITGTTTLKRVNLPVYDGPGVLVGHVSYMR